MKTFGSNNLSPFASTIGVHRPNFSGFSGRMTMRFKDGGGEGGDGGGDGGQGQGDKDKEFEFTPAQQAKIQELVNQSFGKGAGKAEAKAMARIQELETENAKLKGGDKKDGKDQPKTYDEATLKQLLDQAKGEFEPKLTAAQQRIEKLMGHQRSAAIVSAAAKHKAIDPDVVAKLVADSVSFDEDGRLVVLDEKGQPRLNQKAEPLAVEDHVKQFLAERPFLAQAANAGGAGSSTKTGGGAQQATTRPKTWNEATARFSSTLQ